MALASSSRTVWRRSAKYLTSSSKRSRSTTAAAAAEVLNEAATACPFHGARDKLVSSVVAAAASREQRRVVGGKSRPFEQIPTPKGLPLVGTTLELMMSGGGGKLHEYCNRKHAELGPIFKDRLGTVDCVVVSDKEYIDTVYLHEGKHPVHMVPEAWLIYNEKTGTSRGLFFMDGDQWSRRRRILNHVLMNPQAVSVHGPAFNDVITDVIRRWQIVSDRSPDAVVKDLENDLYNWSVESLGTMVFGRRLGCVQPGDDSEHLHEFVRCVREIFTESANMTMIPPRLACSLNLPVWKRFHAAATKAIEMAHSYVEERISEIKRLKAEGQDVSGVLNQLMSDDTIQHGEIVNIVADLIIAAADTTSHATQWALHSLAVNQACQEKLLSEINKVVRPGELVEDHHLDDIPYAMYIIKETLRMYPIASFLTRVLPTDVELGGYNIPAGKLIIMSQYTVGRDPKRFKNPNKFYPERWDRENRETLGSQGCLPFGVGVRSCIGRRVAELQMRLFLTRVVQKFQLESANDKEVGITLRMITTSDTPIRLRLKNRSPTPS